MTFHQFLTIFKARKWIVVAVLLGTVGAATTVCLVLPARWTATASVLVDARGPDPVTGVALSAQMLPGYMATQQDIIQSRTVALKVVDALHVQDDPVAQAEWRKATHGRGSLKVWLAERLLKKLAAKPSRDSSVIEISFSWVDPKFASAAANAFAQAYIDTALELKVARARQQATWFGERTQALRREVKSSAAKLATYQQQKSIVSVDERFDTENARLEQYNAQLSQASAHTADAFARERLARAAAARGVAPDSLPEVVENRLIQRLKTDLSLKESKLKDLAAELGPNYPEYQAAAADVKSARETLRAAMASVVTSLANNAHVAQQKEAELRSQMLAQKDKVLALKKQRDQLSLLVHDAENAQNAFDATTHRYNQTSLESLATQTNVVLLAPAVEPFKPSFPNWPIIVGLSVILGAALGVLSAGLLELTDQRMHDDADVISILALQVLGNMPQEHLSTVPRARTLASRLQSAVRPGRTYGH